MNFSECLAYLERLGNEVLTMKFGLESIRRLLEGLGNPHQRFQSILVAGTNGKGSVARFLASILEASGLRTGLYTSPHLVRLTERIQIGREEIEQEVFAEAFGRVINTLPALGLPSHPTFFEMVTAAALLSFAHHNVEVAVLEIGMGGRLDSTNVVDPVLSMITPIDRDHCQYLGNSLAEIAAEKAGIMRPGVRTLSGLQHREVAEVLVRAGRQVGTLLHFIETSATEVQPNDGCFSFSWEGSTYRLQVCGRFQVENAILALNGARELARLGLPVTPEGMRQGVEAARCPGVIQRARRNPTVILDGGHNPAACRMLAGFLEHHTQGPRTLVFGMMRDKEIADCLAALEPQFEAIHLTRVDSPRAASLEALTAVCSRGISFEDPREAFAAGLAGSETVVVAGSFMLAGLILSQFDG